MAFSATGSASAKDTVERLRRELRQWERPLVHSRQNGIVSSGVAVLDNLLPDFGIGAGELVEWQSGRGCGAVSLVMLQLRAVLDVQSAGMAIVIDSPGTFSPMGAALLGVDLNRLIIIRPRSANQAVWVMEQCLRCSGVVAVCGRLGAISETSARRLKLAARTGGGVGLFLRDEVVGLQWASSWSDVRWRVEPVAVPADQNHFRDAFAGRRLQVELVSCRTGRAGRTVEIDICDETGLVREAPAWPLQRVRNLFLSLKTDAETNTSNAPDKTAWVLYAVNGSRGECVTHCSRRAIELGVHVGMPVTEARTLLRQTASRWERFDPIADTHALGQLAEWCDQFSPWVGMESSEPADSLLLDVTGCEHLYDGEMNLLTHLQQAFEAQNWTVRLAIAETVGAAWALTHGTGSQAVAVPPSTQALRDAVLPLPVSALRIDPHVAETLWQLGLKTIGDITRLPRADLPSRFAVKTVLRLDQVFGQVAESFSPIRPEGVIEAAEAFDWPIANRQTLLVVIERLLSEVLETVHGVQAGITQLRLRIGLEKPLTIGFAQPTDLPKHLFGVITSRLERFRLAGPVGSVRLQVTGFSRFTQRQGQLFEDDNVKAERISKRELGRLMDRLRGRLDEDQLVRPQLQSDSLPEYAATFEPITSLTPKSDSTTEPMPPEFTPLSRPLTMLAEPQALDVVSVYPDGPPLRLRWQQRNYVVNRWWGPERIESGWWRDQQVKRDYYRVETNDGHWFWLFRNNRNDGWYLHGVFD